MSFISNCRENEGIDAGTETNSNLHHEVFYHFLGTDQTEDILCWKDGDNPKYSFAADITDDGKVKNSKFLWVIMCHHKFLVTVNNLENPDRVSSMSCFFGCKGQRVVGVGHIILLFTILLLHFCYDIL